MNNTTVHVTYEYQKEELNLYYAICEIVVAVLAVIGNALVIFVFRKERRLRRRTNYYIVSLALADFLVGLLGIPFAILSSIGLPTNLHACLFTVSLLVVLCTISIFCLVAVSVDRYWAILHPMGYSRNVRTKTALVIISICWMAGFIVGFLPLMGWHKDAPSDGRCFFLDVMDYNYLVFLYFGTIITPALVLAAFYAHIYRVVVKQLRQIVTMNPEKGKSKQGCSSGGTMLRVLGAAQKREVKATQNLSIIVLFFMICWIPLYTINCILAFCRDCHVNPTFMLFCIILSHLNSAGNPLLYAYHLKDFRAALKNFLCNLFNYSNELNPELNRVTLNNNCRVYRFTNKTEDNISQIYYRKKPNPVSKIVQNSTIVAIAPTETNREIWNIPETSSISSDSLEEVQQIHDKISIIRPATPFRPRKISQKNDGFTETSTSNESDNVFLVNELRNEEKKSISSPQLNRNLFLIENSFNKFVKSSSIEECKYSKSSSQLSPFRVVEGIFKKTHKNPLKRSLSNNDGTNVDNDLFLIQKNGTVVRSSCGI